MAKIRILLTDDHTLFRQGIKTLLSAEADLDIVGEAANGAEAVEKTNELRPDLVLAAITSQVPAVLDADEILLSTSELGAVGLPKPSIIKLGKIFTIHQGLIRKKLGNIGEAKLEDVRQKLVELMR